MKPVYVSDDFDAARTATLVLQIEELMKPVITAETDAEIQIRTDEALCALLAVLARLLVQYKALETDPSQPEEIVSRTAAALQRQIRRELARRGPGAGASGFTRQ
jgi:hypothetical protein